MRTAIVGYSGFVGSNLCLSNPFDYLYNSKNYTDAYNLKPDLLIYAGIPGVKYMANLFPEKDLAIVKEGYNSIMKIAAKKTVLISTIDVFQSPDGVNEDYTPNSDSKFHYGYHRKMLEEWCSNTIDSLHIVRLPGIYGTNLKKNFIYDLYNPIPNVLTEKIFNDLFNRSSDIAKFYKLNDKNLYECVASDNEKDKLLGLLNKINFSSCNLTDSRGLFQYFNLKYLWHYITVMLNNNIKILNVTTEPFLISELYQFIKHKEFVNHITDNIPYYNLKSKYAELFGGDNGYLQNKQFVFNDIKNFIGL